MHTYIIYTVCRIYIFFLFSRTNLRLLFSEIIQTNWAITSTTSTTTTKKRHTELIYSLCLCLSFLSFSPFFIYGIVGSFYVRACVCVYMCALNESNSIISLPFLPPPLPPSAFQRIRLPRNCASHWKARLEGRMTFSCCFLTYYDVFSILFLTFGTSIQHDCRDSARPAVDQSRPSALRIWMKSHN
jgi:hypothetical protein